MQYNSKGLTPSTLEENLTQWTNTFRGNSEGYYGNDFTITKEGFLGNLATSFSLALMDYEEQLLFMQKMMNPYTAEDEYQDALYKLIGLERTYATFTVVQRTVEGTPNTTVNKGDILFRNKTTQDQFKLNDDCQLGEDGKGIGSFTAEELGAIDLPNSAYCEIITAPDNVVGVYYSDGNQISIGKEYQSNLEFREEWEAEQSLATTDSEGGLKKALMPYAIDGKGKNVLIRQNRSIKKKYEDIPLCSINAVIHSAYDDETIAGAILKNAKDGPDYVGDINVTLKDSEGTDVEIGFSRAKTVKIYWKIKVKLQDNTYLSQVQNAIKKAIEDNFNLAMGEDVIANKYAQYVYEISGISEVESIEVSKDGMDYGAKVEIADIELAQSGEIDVTE